MHDKNGNKIVTFPGPRRFDGKIRVALGQGGRRQQFNEKQSARHRRDFDLKDAMSWHRRSETALENPEVLLPPQIAHLLRTG